jgi:hypothetical protein
MGRPKKGKRGRPKKGEEKLSVLKVAAALGENGWFVSWRRNCWALRLCISDAGACSDAIP